MLEGSFWLQREVHIKASLDLGSRVGSPGTLVSDEHMMSPGTRTEESTGIADI